MLLFARISVSLGLVAAATAVAAEPANGAALSRENVFSRTTGTAAAQAAAETIEFAGISSIGKSTEYIFIDKTTKKNHWIAKGETKEGITVLNYDPHREEAVVKINGTQKTLPLRKGAGPVNAVGVAAAAQPSFSSPPPLPQAGAGIPALPPVAVTPAVAAPVQAPPAPVAAPAPKPETPNTPEAIAKAETEARMLVSDLLEIGMAQRKAYEEAQRKAAEGKTEQSGQTDQTAQAQAPKQ